MANSVDPDQMPHSAASDLGLHCLQKPVQNFRVITVGMYFSFSPQLHILLVLLMSTHIVFSKRNKNSAFGVEKTVLKFDIFSGL